MKPSNSSRAKKPPAASTLRQPSTSKNSALISLVKGNEAPTPWCDEFEKMISGMDFDARNSEEMQAHKLEIMRICQRFNDSSALHDPKTTLQGLRAGRHEMLKSMIGKLGNRVVVEAPFYCIWGCNTSIGESVYANHGLTLHDTAPITIGARCHIGPNVSIFTEGHGIDVGLRRAGLLYAKPVVIGEDCWIGAGAIILPGITIGKGCTIGAGAVVSGDIEDFSLAAGVPAKVIKKVADPDA